MSKVAIVADSSACIPTDLVERHHISIVPLAFLFDGDAHPDGSMSPREFYTRLRASRRPPSTASPAPGGFLDAFRAARGSGAAAIVCLTLSSAYSGTHDAAVSAAALAAQELPDLPVRVVDTHCLAMSHGFAVLEAAREADAGADLDLVVSVAEAVGSAAHLVGALDTTRYLSRSGRVPLILHWAASLLQVKPILAADAEDARGVGRVRTMAKALDRLLDYLDERQQGGESLHVAVMHADAPERAQELAARLRERFSPKELLITEFSTVMGVHTGPGFVGLAFYSETNVPGLDSASRSSSASRLERDVGALEIALGKLPSPVRKPALVVVSGLPGAGKSHLGREISKGYPLAHLESDALRKVLFRHPDHGAEESKRLFVACHALLDSLLARGVSALLDATNLKEMHRRPLYRIAERNGAKLVLVEVQAPAEVARRRLEERSRGENPWDLSDAGPDVYKRMRNDVESIEREHLVVDTSRDIAPAVRRIVAELQESSE
jgi:DegV family protein with EDD domain